MDGIAASSPRSPESPSPRSAVELRRDRTLALGTFAALAVAIFAVYGRGIDAPFIFDDIPGIVENPSIVRLWPLIGDAQTPGPLRAPRYGPTDRRPLVNLTFALSHHFGGLDPAGYRLVSILLHVIAAALLAAIIRRTLRLAYFRGAWDRAAWALSFAVALVWALHPANTEAVMYVTQRTELMVAVFSLATLYAAIRYWTARSRAARAGWLTLAGVSCVAGMASKEVMAAAPIVVFLFERTFVAPSVRDIRRSWPLYLSLMPGWVVLFLLTYRGAFGVTTDARHSEPIYVWWLTQAKVLFLYLKLAVWPWPLSIHYAPRFVRTLQAGWPWLAALGVFAGATLVLSWRRRPLGFVLAVMGLVLAPTMVAPILKVVAAERRMYLALAGFVTLAIVGGYRAISTRWPAIAGRVAVVAVTIVVVLFAAVSTRRLAAYETAVTIWQDAVVNQPDDAMSHYNLGEALLDEDRPQDAIGSFEAALAIEPDYTLALDNMGAALNSLGRPQEAIPYFEQALKLEPDDTVALNNLGLVLTDLGRPEDAIEPLSQALRLRPNEPKAKVHLNLGKALLDVGRAEDALAHLEQAVRLEPDNGDMHYGLANALLRTGKVDAAVHRYRRALELNPDSAEAHNNLGIALLQLDRPAEAISHFERALRVKPNYANAHYNLGNAFLNGGRPREAAQHFREAARLSPDDAQARFNGAIAYARSDQRPQAIAMAEESLALARSRGETALAGEISAWLESYRGAP